MRVVGAAIVKDAIRLEFPIVAAVRSVLPIVDRMVVNVGRSDDGTLEYLRQEFAREPVDLLDREWDTGRGGLQLADETDVACEHLDADWIVYVQADEVIHETGLEHARRSMTENLSNEQVDGLLVDFIHHYGDPATVATSRLWYAREVRLVRSGRGVRSHHEAQGFRAGGEPLKACASGATYHHYGWARPATALTEKSRLDEAIYGRKPARSVVDLPWEFGLRDFGGTHPAAVSEWLAGCAGRHARVAARRWTARQLRLAVSHAIESLTGKRPWEYRNYIEVS